jgi:hypothetical protein
VPDEAIGCGFHEAVRGVLSHHVVIRDGKIANYHPYPPTPWNANPRDIYGTPGPYEDAVQNTPIFEENGPDKFKGIDIMRAVRSFDPCLPCGVHMYLGNGKVLETHHSPMLHTSHARRSHLWFYDQGFAGDSGRCRVRSCSGYRVVDGGRLGRAASQWVRRTRQVDRSSSCCFEYKHAGSAARGGQLWRLRNLPASVPRSTYCGSSRAVRVWPRGASYAAPRLLPSIPTFWIRQYAS